MKRLLLLLSLPLILTAQIKFVAQKTTTLSGAAEVVTIQQPSTGSKLVELKSAYIDCSVVCTVTLERAGTPASSTALTPVGVNGETAVATAWYSSNVGTGTTLSVATIQAGGSLTFDLSGITLKNNNDRGQNFTLRTSSITGTVNIIVAWTER